MRVELLMLGLLQLLILISILWMQKLILIFTILRRTLIYRHHAELSACLTDKLLILFGKITFLDSGLLRDLTKLNRFGCVRSTDFAYIFVG